MRHLAAVGAEAALFVMDEGDREGGGCAVAIGVFIEKRHDVAVEVITEACVEGSKIVGEGRTWIGVL